MGRNKDFHFKARNSGLIIQDREKESCFTKPQQNPIRTVRTHCTDSIFRTKSEFSKIGGNSKLPIFFSLEKEKKVCPKSVYRSLQQVYPTIFSTLLTSLLLTHHLTVALAADFSHSLLSTTLHPTSHLFLLFNSILFYNGNFHFLSKCSGEKRSWIAFTNCPSCC